MVRRLGELLVERGAVSIGELHTALDACHWSGGRLGTQLLRLGFVDEAALLEALSEQFQVPAVREDVLLHSPRQVRTLISEELQRRWLAVPFERGPGVLGVAMVNPRDLHARSEIERLAGLKVRPHVASEVAVLKVLDISRSELARAGEGAAGRPARSVDPEAWNHLWAPPRLQSRELSAVGCRDPEGGGEPELASFPELVPLLRVERSAVWSGLDQAQLRAGLLRATHRDDVARLLVGFARSRLERVFLLAVHREAARGWMSGDGNIALDDLQAVEIPLDRPCLLAGLVNSSGFHLGRVPAGSGNRPLLEIFGEPAPAEVLIVPVRVKTRAIAFLVGDDAGREIDPVVAQELKDAADRAGIAFEILILRRKI